jgi:hypothetical protein
MRIVTLRAGNTRYTIVTIDFIYNIDGFVEVRNYNGSHGNSVAMHPDSVQ